MPQLSIIIPTRNRALTLGDALRSLPKACLGVEPSVECLVIDNGSTDDTRAISESFAAAASFPVRYIYEPRPGLHVGRNLGATLAQGGILAYLDDDVLVRPGWGAALLARFADDPANMIVGGPCLPHWEVTPPAWIEALRSPLPDGGWSLGQLSLIYMGDTPKPVSGRYIYGCNFAIRRPFVLECGGFHPDGLPPHLLRFRGDGETEMGMKVDAHPEYTAFYDPAVTVLHRVPASRMTNEYLAGIAKRTAVGYAYSAYRDTGGGLVPSLRQGWRLTSLLFEVMCRWLEYPLRKFVRRAPAAKGAAESAAAAYALEVWRTYRQYVRICCSPTLRAWVIQPSYLPGSPCPYHEKQYPAG